MGITWPVWTDDSGAGTDGTILNNAQHNLDRDAINTHVGDWTAVTFSAGNFTANTGGPWTVASGDVKRNRYQKINKTLHWQLTIRTSSLTGATTTLLQVAIPTGAFSDAESRSCDGRASDNGTDRPIRVQVVSGSLLGIARTDAVAWAASTDATDVHFDIEFELT